MPQLCSKISELQKDDINVHVFTQPVDVDSRVIAILKVNFNFNFIIYFVYMLIYFLPPGWILANPGRREGGIGGGGGAQRTHKGM